MTVVLLLVLTPIAFSSIRVYIKPMQGEPFFVDMDARQTVGTLKSKIGDLKYTGYDFVMLMYPLAQQELAYAGTSLRDDQTISQIGYTEDQTIDLITPSMKPQVRERLKHLSYAAKPVSYAAKHSWDQEEDEEEPEEELQAEEEEEYEELYDDDYDDYPPEELEDCDDELENELNEAEPEDSYEEESDES